MTFPRLREAQSSDFLVLWFKLLWSRLGNPTPVVPTFLPPFPTSHPETSGPGGAERQRRKRPGRRGL